MGHSSNNKRVDQRGHSNGSNKRVGQRGHSNGSKERVDQGNHINKANKENVEIKKTKKLMNKC